MAMKYSGSRRAPVPPQRSSASRFLRRCRCRPFAAVPASAEEMVKVSLNAPFDGSNAAFFLAEERGYYAAEGIKPSFDPSGGSGQAVTRIGSGTYDFGFGDINVLLDFNAKNPDAAGRAVYMIYYRSPLSIGSFAKAGISKPTDLPGKKLGGSLGDGAYKLWPAYTNVTGIKPDSVTWSYGDLRLREAMLLKGDVDGILGFDSTMYFNLVRQGIKPADIKFLYYSDAGMDLYGNALLASKKVMAERPNVVKGFIKATAKGWQDAIKDPKAAIAALKKHSSLVDEAHRNRKAQLADQEPDHHAPNRRPTASAMSARSASANRWPWSRKPSNCRRRSRRPKCSMRPICPMLRSESCPDRHECFC